jgi:hypothetical protein
VGSIAAVELVEPEELGDVVPVVVDAPVVAVVAWPAVVRGTVVVAPWGGMLTDPRGWVGEVADGLGFGLGAGGLLDELDDGLGFVDCFGTVAAGGAVLGAPPEPNAKPMTVPGAGS